MASRTVDFVVNLKGNLEQKADASAAAMGRLQGKGAAVTAGLAAITAAATAAAAAFVNLIEGITETVDQVNTLSAATGLSNDAINGLRLAAEASGKSLKDIVPVKLAKNMFTAAESGGKMAEAFERVGVAYQDAVTGQLRNADDVFVEVIQSLSEMENRTEAAAIAAEIMGKQGRELLTAFDDSAGFEQFVNLGRQFGTRVGPEAVKAAGEWQAATANLGLAFENAAQRLADAFGGQSGVAKLLEDFTLGFVFVTELVSSMVGRISERLGALVKALAAFKAGDLNSALSNLRIGAEVFDLGSFYEDLGKSAMDAFRRSRDFFETRAGSTPRGGAVSFAGAGGEDAAPPPNEAEKATVIKITDLLALAEKEAESAEAERLRLFALADTLPGRFDDFAAAMEGLADEIDSAVASKIGEMAAAITSVDSLLRGVDLFGLGETAATALAVARNLDETLMGLLRDFRAIPGDLADGIGRTLSTVLPGFVRLIPDLLVGLLVELPVAIAQGVIAAGPALVEAFADVFTDLGGQVLNAADSVLTFLLGPFWERTRDWFGRQFANIGDLFSSVWNGPFLTAIREWWNGVWAGIREFFANLFTLGGDGGLLTGKEGKVLGTSFKPGDLSILGVDIPGFQTGGFVRRTGLAMVHEGERIVPSNGASTGAAAASRGFGGGVTVNVGQIVAPDPRVFVRELEQILGEYGMGETLTPFAP